MNRTQWRARACIDTAAARHNLTVARNLARNAKIIAVVKANAYGHDLAIICRALAGEQNDHSADEFAVATIAEGMQCRKVLQSLDRPIPAKPIPITVLSDALLDDAFELCAHYDLCPVLHTVAQIDRAARYDGAPIQAWVKINTGMHRLGVAADDAPRAVAKLKRNAKIHRLRLMSHFARADEPDNNFSARQLTKFNAVCDNAPCRGLARSIANSAAVLTHPASHLDYARPGIMLYGGAAARGRCAAEVNLRAVMQLQSRLLSVQKVAAGCAIGYGGLCIARKPMRVGIVGVGYADGYPRNINIHSNANANNDNANINNNPDADSDSPAVLIPAVLIHGRRAPIVGRVSMDTLAVDVSAITQAAPGDAVELWGRGIAIDEVARWAGTIAHELLCRVGARVPRIALNAA